MSVIPISSALYEVLQTSARSCRMIFVTGIPGVGKSLLIQQLSILAREAGRQVYLLQYNVAREPFESEGNLSKYPEVDGFTDPAIRKAVGLWAREAVLRWHTAHPGAEHLLIGELPLIGSRFIELVEPHDDAVEPLLAGESTQFIIPVPSWEVREVIEERRARTIADPQHEREKLDAPPNVLQALWEEVNRLAREIQLTKANPKTPYNPYIYGGVYEALLQHRHFKSILIEQVLRPTKSVYEMEVVASQLQATPEEVSATMQRVEAQYTPDELNEAVWQWHAIITKNPRTIDPGSELRLPLPDALPGAVGQTELTAVQKTALHAITQLPLDATPQEMIPALDAAIVVLNMGLAGTAVKANVHKFDIYDSYFNVTRTQGSDGVAFLAGLLQAYRNVMEDLQVPPHTLTVVELPMLRIALETTLRQFGIY